MNVLKDYYKILQVHYLAEPEIIQSSYRRLARKYHPDVNKGSDAEEIMKKINEAYKVLNNPEKRKQYHREWVKRRAEPGVAGTKEEQKLAANKKSLTAALAVLNEYFQNILHKNFARAYALVSENDKENISPAEFTRWQKTVSKVYQLKKYSFTLHKLNKNIMYNKVIYKEAVDLQVAVREYNKIIDAHEQDYLVKTIVLEDKNWKVLLGYEGLQPLIDKFIRLSELVQAKSIINELAESRSKIDPLTGLYNTKGFLELAEKEHYRYVRYKNTFSLALCEIDTPDEETIKKAAHILDANLRKTDILGRWQNSTFLILLAETNIKGALQALQKIQRHLQGSILRQQKNNISIGVLEFCHQSLQEGLEKALQYKDIAKGVKRNTIVSQEGIV